MDSAHHLSHLGWAIVIVFISWSIIVTVTYALRIHVQFKILKRPSTWEDYFAGLGWLLFLAFSGLVVATTFYGLGQHTSSIPPSEQWVLANLIYYHQLIFILANMAIKQSIGLMLLHYAVEDYHKKLVHVVNFVLQSYSMVLFFYVLLQCVPVSFYWTRWRGDTDGRCMDRVITINMTYGYSGALVLYDLTMALLPWFMVRKLQLDLRTRLMVTTILAFGSIACVVTIIRVPFVVKLTRTDDLFYDITLVFILSCCEAGLAFATSCAAKLKPLFRRKSSQDAPHTPARVPKLNTIPATMDGSCSTAITKQGDVEFSTSFYGTEDTSKA